MLRLDHLEERIDRLLGLIASLEKENANLKETEQDRLLLVEENRKLRLALQEERAKSETALHRIDTLLQKLTMEDGEA